MCLVEIPFIFYSIIWTRVALSPQLRELLPKKDVAIIAKGDTIETNNLMWPSNQSPGVTVQEWQNMWCDLQTQLLIILNINWKEAWLSGICTHRTFAANSIPDSTAHNLSNSGYKQSDEASFMKLACRPHTGCLRTKLGHSVVNKCKFCLLKFSSRILSHASLPHSTVFGVSKISIQRHFLLEGNFMGPADALM